jgi:large subunit ribosomal protein L25
MDTLKIQKRNMNNKTHHLRDNGMIPGTIFGPTIDSFPIKLTHKQLREANENKGEVYRVKWQDNSFFVKFGEIQTDPITQEYLHFSLVQLPKNVENDVEIPVNLKGTPIGVKKGGTLVVMKNEVTINGVPRLIPDQVEANVSKLDIGDKLEVKDLKLPKKLDTKDNLSEVVAVCTPPVKATESTSDEPLLESSSTEPNVSIPIPASAF